MNFKKTNANMDFYDTAKAYTSIPVAYDPFPDFYEKVISFTNNSPSPLYSGIIKNGEAALAEGFPYISASMYMRFVRDGNRSDYENDCFKKRHMLNSLVIAECLEKKGRFIDKIVDGIFSVCEESSWCIPAHNTYVRDTPAHILPDVSRPVIDLFACETGALMSMIVYLLEDRLNEISPLICNRIRIELEKRIITPYMTAHFWWMGNGDEPMCNWTPWCTQNVLLCAFLKGVLDLPDDTKKKIFERAAASVDFFLKDYSDDGCCDEGAQYYKHAGLCLYGCTEILNAISFDAFIGFYDTDKIKNIASYLANVHIEGPWYFNFADCSPKAGRAGAREFLFGKKTKQAFLCDFASKDYIKSLKEATISSDESVKQNLYYRTQAYYYAKDIYEYSLETSDAPATITSDNNYKKIWYESVGLLIVKNNNMALAIKGGDNDDSHNHNDTGSITLFKNGNPILVDIGVETYTAKTFSKDRYSIWTMQSGYHNLPTIMGMDELPGANHCATNISLIKDINDKVCGVNMNIEKAYPEEIGSKYYYNRNVFLNLEDDLVELTDTTDAPDTILNFITYHKPNVISDSGAIAIDNAMLEAFGGELISVETLPIVDERLKTAWDHDLYRIRFKMNKEFKLSVK